MAGMTLDLASIPASGQFRAIAFLRWRLFVNAFRRKGGAGEIIARIVVYPIALLFIVGPSVGAGVGSWALVSSGHLHAIPAVFWAITLLQIVVSINISQPGLSFDPESLIRFPLAFTRYLIVRLFLGLLSASTVIGSCALLSAAIGITVARHDLAWIAFAAAILLALANILFIRMIFAWIDRWLSTRRAREFFTGFIILFSIGIQYLNVTYNPGFSHRDVEAQRHKIVAASHFYHSSHFLLSRFPAGLAGASIVNVAHGATPYAVANLFATLLFGVLFLAVFASRMQREYRGENLSDSGSLAQPAPTAALARSASAPPPVPAIAHRTSSPTNSSAFSQAFRAAFYKEWIYVRRNTAQLYGLLAPLAMVFLFAGRVGSGLRAGTWTFPAAICYSALGVAALSYNAFGLDAAGVQFYFLAPVRLHTILFAKNVFTFAISAIEAVIVYAVLCIVTVRPPLLPVLGTLCWLLFAVLVNVTVGNMRSIIAPKKMDPGKLSRRQASQLSALMSIGILLAVAALGAGVFLLSARLDVPWLPIPVFLALAATAAAFYIKGLKSLDALAHKHRETMIEELCKTS